MPSPKRTAKPKPKAEGRKKSRLTQAGDEAAHLARRTLLLTVLDACKWNLTRAAEALEMSTHADVLRAIKELGLEAELGAARQRGDVAKRRDSAT